MTPSTYKNNNISPTTATVQYRVLVVVSRLQQQAVALLATNIRARSDFGDHLQSYKRS